MPCSESVCTQNFSIKSSIKCVEEENVCCSAAQGTLCSIASVAKAKCNLAACARLHVDERIVLVLEGRPGVATLEHLAAVVVMLRGRLKVQFMARGHKVSHLTTRVRQAQLLGADAAGHCANTY